MPHIFEYDIFLSHSSKDKAVVRPLAERLRKDGLKVWPVPPERPCEGGFDEWVLKPGDSIPAKIDPPSLRGYGGTGEGLFKCGVRNGECRMLQAGIFRFRDPLNKERRFIPLRLDDAPIKGSLAQFLFIKWLPADRGLDYAELLGACRNPTDWPTPPKENSLDASVSRLNSRLVGTRRSEWRRLRADFEAESRKYHDAKLFIFYIAKDEPPKRGKFPQPNHAINLWQYYGSTQSKETMDGLRSLKVTKFGAVGAELSAFGLITGKQMDLFCKMAKRAGSLLPDKVNRIIADRLFQILEEAKEPGKPVVTTNSNSLAKWFNLMLITTAVSHPERFRDGLDSVDPFATSLTVFDFFKLGD